MYTVTNTIYTLVADNTQDETPTWSKLWGISYTAVSVGAPAFFTNLARNQSSSELYKFFSIVLSLPIYFIFFETLYLIAFGIWYICKLKSFGKTYYGILPIFYLGCLGTWAVLSKDTFLSVRFILVTTLFTLSLILNCISFFYAQEFAEKSFAMKNKRYEDILKKNQQSSTEPVKV